MVDFNKSCYGHRARYHAPIKNIAVKKSVVCALASSLKQIDSYFKKHFTKSSRMKSFGGKKNPSMYEMRT